MFQISVNHPFKQYKLNQVHVTYRSMIRGEMNATASRQACSYSGWLAKILHICSMASAMVRLCTCEYWLNKVMVNVHTEMNDTVSISQHNQN